MLSRRFFFADSCGLKAAYDCVADDPWVENCSIDLPTRCLRVTLRSELAEHSHSANLWFKRTEQRLCSGD